MPIVDIEIVLKPKETLRKSLSSEIANEFGSIFNSPRAATWVKLHILPSDMYAENGEEQNTVYPIFVSVIKSRLPEAKELNEEAKRISNSVARITGRPAENVHIIFEQDGTGRIAFGGKLLTE